MTLRGLSEGTGVGVAPVHAEGAGGTGWPWGCGHCWTRCGDAGREAYLRGRAALLWTVYLWETFLAQRQVSLDRAHLTPTPGLP